MSPKEKEMKAPWNHWRHWSESTIEYLTDINQRRDACVTEIENGSGR
jgi:hypothetical protein